MKFAARVKRYLRRKFKKEVQKQDPIKILLLTNRDSDNTGDQIIEACDIALIHAAMKNMGMQPGDYTISSRAAAIVNKKYIANREEKDLEGARKAVKDADLVIFGGAPMFNYTYQDFYERTAITLDLCKEYNVPVIFSAVGIEYYKGENEKCRRITEAVNYPVVRQVTTRDDFESLQKMKQREDLVIARTSDPAVFADKVMERFKKEKKGEKKRIGLVVIRAFAFKDNGYNFPPEKAGEFWSGLYREFTDRGYVCELLTNGHFGDEAFLDKLVRDYGVPVSKAKFNVNKLEDIVGHLSRYDGVVSCRLHPGIVSYSMQIPSVSLMWNMKVQGFYDAIGYGYRVIPAEEIGIKRVADDLEKAMAEGVEHDHGFQLSVYRYLFTGIRDALQKTGEPYTYEELLENLPPFEGTDEKEARLKLERKFRRAYEGYNKRQEKNAKLKTQNVKLKRENKELKEKQTEA